MITLRASLVAALADAVPPATDPVATAASNDALLATVVLPGTLTPADLPAA